MTQLLGHFHLALHVRLASERMCLHNAAPSYCLSLPTLRHQNTSCHSPHITQHLLLSLASRTHSCVSAVLKKTSTANILFVSSDSRTFYQRENGDGLLLRSGVRDRRGLARTRNLTRPPLQVPLRHHRRKPERPHEPQTRCRPQQQRRAWQVP